MDSDKKTPTNATPPTAEEPKVDTQQTPVDALSRTPDELEEEQATRVDNSSEEITPVKKTSALKRIFKKVNVYFLIFFLLLIVAGAITVVNFINSQKEPAAPNVATQELTQDALQQLSNNDASVGDISQTLTIQGNAIIAGQTLTRGDLNVAGKFQSGGDIQGPSITISGSASLGQAQINTLQVATNAAVQGSTTLRDLTVAGTASFSGPITASQLTVTKLVISGNGILEIPNHITFSGPSPGITNNATGLGNGGTASVNGSDTSGTVNINTGNNPAVGCFARITFRQAFTTQPRVIVSPVGSGASLTQFYVERNNAGFNLCTTTAAPANQQFAFDYFVAN
jgi:cytoskeletal protein CcmA (bactofilin family)